MKTKKENKLKKRQLWRYNSPLIFLVFSIALAVTIVACNKDFLETPESDTTNAINSNYGEIRGTNQVGGFASWAFKQIGNGILNQVGKTSFGWVMGAIGLSQGDDASQQEIVEALGQINAELEDVNQNLVNIENELGTIINELAIANCLTVSSDLFDAISHVDNLINGQYKTIVDNAAIGIPTSPADLGAFADLVLNGSATQDGMGDILASFKTILVNSGTNSLIVLCLDPGKITPPAAGAFGDSEYYNQVAALTEYYYAYWTQALILYVEASNYQTWYTADTLRLIDSTYSTSNANTICAINQEHIKYLCGQTVHEVYHTYASLKTFFTQGGAPYTNNNQVIHNDLTEPILWATSIENFNEDAGVNCGDPMVMGDSKCGPTYGNYNMPLSHTTYNNLSGWEFAGTDDLKKLINPNSASSFTSIGLYLESVGFKNMAYTSRVVQANDTVSVVLLDCNTSLTVIPFFFTDWPVIQHGENHGGNKFAVFENDDDFNVLMRPMKYYSDSYKICGSFGSGYHWHYYYPQNGDPNTGSKYFPLYYNPDLPYARDKWFKSYAVMQACMCQSPHFPFYTMCYTFWWTDGGYTENDAFMPGWLAYRQDNPEGPSGPAYAFLWPIKRLLPLQCTDGRSGRNSVGVLSMCGDDFTAWLTIILPKPPGYN